MTGDYAYASLQKGFMMGVTIHYRGKMDDVGQIERMEDQVFDLVVSLGGKVKKWRSKAAHDASRVVRGLIINIAL